MNADWQENLFKNNSYQQIKQKILKNHNSFSPVINPPFSPKNRNLKALPKTPTELPTRGWELFKNTLNIHFAFITLGNNYRTDIPRAEASYFPLPKKCAPEKLVCWPFSYSPLSLKSGCFLPRVQLFVFGDLFVVFLTLVWPVLPVNWKGGRKSFHFPGFFLPISVSLPWRTDFCAGQSTSRGTDDAKRNIIWFEIYFPAFTIYFFPPLGGGVHTFKRLMAYFPVWWRIYCFSWKMLVSSGKL